MNSASQVVHADDRVRNRPSNGSQRCGYRRTTILALFVLMTCTAAVRSEQPLLLLDRAPRGNLALVHVDLTAAVQRGDIDARRLPRLQASNAANDASLPAQFIPAPGATGSAASSTPVTEGMLVLQVPPGFQGPVRLMEDQAQSTPISAGGGEVDTAACRIAYDPLKMAGFPSRIQFGKTRKDFQNFAWNDRLHHQELGGFLLRNDKQASVSVVSDGPLCRVVRVEASYKRADGTQPSSQPRAVYDWYYFRNVPLVYVTAVITQKSSFRWNEVHFLELNFPGKDFLHWAGGQREAAGQLVGDSQSQRMPDWAALVDGSNAIGMFGCGTVLVHDGRGHYGTYLHAEGDRSWQPWDDTVRRYSGWLWIGCADSPQQAIAHWQQQLPLQLPGTVTTQRVHDAIANSRRDAEQLADAARAAQRWNIAVASRLERGGRAEAALDALAGKLPDDWQVLEAGDLRLAVTRGASGIRLASLFDSRANHEHLGADPGPLFRITLRNAESQQLKTIDADQGWQQLDVNTPNSDTLVLRWHDPVDSDVGALQVTAEARADPNHSAVHWRFNASGEKEPWGLWHVIFPQLEVVAPGDDPVLLIPRGPGEEQLGVWDKAFSFQGRYPSGWTSMQFMAVYDRQSQTGLYWAIHDPFGGTKDFAAKTTPPTPTLAWTADVPVPDMGKPGNAYQLEGEAVWQAFQGDWYDAAVIYRDWVRTHARWYPKLGGEGREDTPAWMRELCVWAQTGGAAASCVDQVQRFAEYLGVPVGFHWYSWHKIPFDNDYPHYFPPKDDFAQGVQKLHEANVFVMPYINGRLWDTRDHGLEDSEFTKKALPAATKNEDGKPYTEVYGSKESDGSPVRLAVMCPTTSTWQDEIHGIVGRLLNQYDVDGVYIDQIAAAAPVTCMDSTHGHPLGGGHWWNEGYWQMLEKIRHDMQPDQMLTTECNAEPFVKWFDGYLTWHWQFDGQVPAFPAIYGGAIQMFGRAYRGGATRDLALRMKSAQQLVFGEQIGWLNPNVVDQEENASFLRQVVRLRWQLRRYFHAGQMLRPPKLQGDIPRVRADWQWQNEWWVETDGVLTGAWRLPREESVVVILANVTDKPVVASWTFDAAESGLQADQLHIRQITCEGPEAPNASPATFKKQIELPPRTVLAWEITP